jgi:magnesium chelatase accessory protein
MPLDWERDGRDWPNRRLSRFVRRRAVRWHIQRGGSGPGLLLIHGAGGSTHSFADLVPLLLAECEVMALDLPGQGFSSGSAPRFSLPAMAADIGDLLAAEDFAPRLIVGHSAGAAIALRMVLDGRARPWGILCLAGALTPFRGAAGLVFPAMAWMLALNPFAGALIARGIAPRLVEGLIESTGSRVPPRQVALYRRLIGSPSHVAATLAMMARWDLTALVRDLPRLDLPVTLAIGGRDRAVPAEATAAAAARLPSCAIRRFDDLGHLLHEEAPERIAALIRDRLAAEALPCGQA